jgi:hypothetical protein
MTDIATQPNPTAELGGQDDHDALDDESWLDTATPKGIHVRAPLAALTLGIALAIGVWGGAKVEASQSSPSAATSTAAAGRAAAGVAGGAGGAPGASGAGGAGGVARGGVTGTIASVQGTTIQLTTSTGSTVTVNLLPSTTIARTATATPSDLSAGETITVRGQTGTDGSTTAQAVTIVPATTPGG